MIMRSPNFVIITGSRARRVIFAYWPGRWPPRYPRRAHLTSRRRVSSRAGRWKPGAGARPAGVGTRWSRVAGIGIGDAVLEVGYGSGS
jgi:hypothetical protein